MNALDLLKQQHEKVTKALSKIAEGAPASSTELRTIADELVAHMVIEEHIFYPRVRELMKGIIAEAFEEHAVARFELARLLQAETGDRKTRALVLKELLRHHIDEEEKEMFPKVKKGIDAAELTALGTKMQQTFESAVAKGFAAFFPPPTAKTTSRNGIAGVSRSMHAR